MSQTASVQTSPVPLAQAFATQRLSESCLIALVGGLLDPLEALHRQGRTHTNISPATILWSREGGPELGPVTITHTEREDGSLQLHTRPGFTPLEAYQLRAALGPWSDLYSLGALSYWLMTGQPPPDAPSRAVCDTHTALSRNADSNYSASWRGLVDALLALLPGQRPQDVAELRTRLAPLQATMAAPSLVTQQSVYAPDPEQLDAVRALLSQHLLGPVASALINQAARKSADWASFCETIAAHVGDETLRSKFLARFASTATQRARPSAAAPTPIVTNAFPPGMLEALETELKDTLGAVARIVIRKASQQASGRDALFKAIAAEIENPLRAQQFMTWAEGKFGNSREQ